MIPAVTVAITLVTVATAQVASQETMPGSMTDILKKDNTTEFVSVANVTNGTPDKKCLFFIPLPPPKENENARTPNSYYYGPYYLGYWRYLYRRASKNISSVNSTAGLISAIFPAKLASYPYFQVSTIPIPYEPRYFVERTKSDMREFLDRAARDVDFAESQISLATEFSRTSINNDVNEAKNFVIRNHEMQFNEAVQNVIDEDYLWGCAKKGEKLVEIKSRIFANRINDCIKRASNIAMDVVTSTKSHIAEDRTRRTQKFNEDIQRLSACIRQQERHCIREQMTLIERNVNSLAADAKNEVERVREARRQQISEFSVCRRFQDQSYLQLLSLSDTIVDLCIKNSNLGVRGIST